MSLIITRLLLLYKRFFSPLVPVACRFYPSCSDYARQAVGHYGVGRGLLLALARLARCHPFNAGGYDPPVRPSRGEAPASRPPRGYQS